MKTSVASPMYHPLSDRVPSSGLAPAQGAEFRLACYSFLILFFELGFIRYTSAYVRVFGFYLNFVLIATFLGIGVGMLRAGSARLLKWGAVPALLLIVGAVAYFGASRIAVPKDPNEYVWGVFNDANRAARTIPMLPVVVALFTLCSLFFIPLGALMGAEFRKLAPLRAYTFDILGSLAGIAIFGLLSATREPPVVWFGTGLLLWVLLSLDDWRFAVSLAAAGAAALTLTQWTQGPKPEYWSPYYRINVAKYPGEFEVSVNGSLHQVVLDLDSTAAQASPYTKVIRAAYLRPYSYAARLDTALVVGSGTGNDLALLLHSGAKYIDAVEIDPQIADLGEAIHFQQPYTDPRVHLHVNDARAFMRRATQKYDVIVFGTLDSQTLLSGMSSVRLDNYVYTTESFRAARQRLKPDGTMILYHMSGLGYIAAKIYQMLGSAFQTPPRVFVENDNLFNYTFVAGYGARGASPPANAPWLTEKVDLPHDDWPYLYLSKRIIPAHYIVALGSILLVSLLVMGVGASEVLRGGMDWAMFFMGTGFLLVETKSVTEMSLLFGSTWSVNLLVFASILVMVLLANTVVLKRPMKRTWAMFGGLFASLLLAYLVPASALLSLPGGVQWLLGGVMVALPVLFAALIFSTLLARRMDASRALAYNLLGAIIGGILEYSSMAVGIKALYLIAAATYLLAMVATLREERGSTGVRLRDIGAVFR
jgi:SAM-dependent methyltransferase